MGLVAIDLSFDDATFSGQVPLFPLPGAVLLPGGVLPLHIFEQRYREMVEAALASERLIGMALLKPGYEANYEGNPAIEEHTCVGRIAMEQRLEDGRYNLVLAGLRRARIVSEDQSRSFRVATVQLAPDLVIPAEEERAQALTLLPFFRALPAALTRDTSRFGVALRLLEGEVPGTLALGTVVDLCADTLRLDVEDRKRLLETTDVQERIIVLNRSLRRIGNRLVDPAERLPPWTKN